MKVILCSAVFLMLLPSCIKDKDYKPTLPGITTSGANTMGFIYDESSIWTSLNRSIDLFGPPQYTPFASCTLQYYQDSSASFDIRGDMYLKTKKGTVTDNSNFEIDLNKAVFTNKTYLFDTINVSRVIFENNLVNKTYYNIPNTFTLTVTNIDTSKEIISGLFSGTLYHFNNNNGYNVDDSLKIHEGRFDIKYLHF